MESCAVTFTSGCAARVGGGGGCMPAWPGVHGDCTRVSVCRPFPLSVEPARACATCSQTSRSETTAMCWGWDLWPPLTLSPWVASVAKVVGTLLLLWPVTVSPLRSCLAFAWNAPQSMAGLACEHSALELELRAIHFAVRTFIVQQMRPKIFFFFFVSLLRYYMLPSRTYTLNCGKLQLRQGRKAHSQTETKVPLSRREMQACWLGEVGLCPLGDNGFSSPIQCHGKYSFIAYNLLQCCSIHLIMQ